VAKYVHWANLFDRVKESTSDSDEIIIISGYASASIIDEVENSVKRPFLYMECIPEMD